MSDKIDNYWFENVDLKSETRDRLWFLMSSTIDTVLDDFYEILRTSPYSHILEKADTNRLKELQKAHWRRIILYRVDNKYGERLRKMHEKHQQVGLLNRHYIRSYMYFLNRFQEAILRGSNSPREAYALISALHSIFSDDIARALEVQCIPPNL
jgi:hypothetical protein